MPPMPRRESNKKPSDPSTFIMSTDGHLSIWTWVDFSQVIGKMSCNTSFDVLFNIFNKMKFDFAYFDVSHNIEILHLNDYNKLKMKLINNWKRKLNL